MKQLYISPAISIEESVAAHIIAESAPNITIKPGVEPVIGEELDVKEASDDNIWNEEW